MGKLLNAYREQMSKHKDIRMKQEADPDVQYATGFAPFDFINGTKNAVETDQGYVDQYNIGIVDGSMCMFIGRSGCGKTTFAVQTAANIADQFEEAEIYHDDIEGGITDLRRMTLTKWSAEKLRNKYRIRDTGITAENFYESISTIKDLKLANYDAYSYNTGMYDIYGNPVIKLQPTIYILDSVAMLMPEKYTEEDELSGQMSSTAAAKTNAMSFKRIVPMLKAANIILFLINHINEDVQIGPFAKKPTLSYLKVGETLTGGRTVGYLTNLLLRFDDNTKLKVGEGMDIAGCIVDIQIVKSRTGRSGATCSLVFDFENGFDPDLSLYQLLKNYKRIGGAGAYLYIIGHTDKKFSQKNIKDMLMSDAEFRNIFIMESLAVLKSLVTDNATLRHEEQQSNITVSSGIMEALRTASMGMAA